MKTTSIVLASLVLIMLTFSCSLFAARDNDALEGLKKADKLDVEKSITNAFNKIISLFLYVVVPLIGTAIIAWAGLGWGKGNPNGKQVFIDAVTGVAIGAGAVYIVAFLFSLF